MHNYLDKHTLAGCELVICCSGGRTRCHAAAAPGRAAGVDIFPAVVELTHFLRDWRKRFNGHSPRDSPIENFFTDQIYFICWLKNHFG
jgi:hypothetical protein